MLENYKTSREDIENYFNDFKQKKTVMREMKLMVLGHGRIGKSTLVDAIQEETSYSYFQQKEELTQGTLEMHLSEIYISTVHCSH